MGRAVDRTIVLLPVLISAAIAGYLFFFQGSANDRKNIGPRVGLITKRVNDVRRKSQRALAWKPAPAQSDVYNEDRIFTGDKSKAAIALRNGARLALNEKSLLVISLSEEAARPDEVSLELGSFLSRLAKGGSYLLKTKDKIIHIQSPEAAELRIEAKNNVAEIQVISGLVEVATEVGLGKFQSRTISENQVAAVSDAGLAIEKKKVAEPIDAETRELLAEPVVVSAIDLASEQPPAPTPPAPPSESPSAMDRPFFVENDEGAAPPFLMPIGSAPLAPAPLVQKEKAPVKATTAPKAQSISVAVAHPEPEPVREQVRVEPMAGPIAPQLVTAPSATPNATPTSSPNATAAATAWPQFWVWLGAGVNLQLYRQSTSGLGDLEFQYITGPTLDLRGGFMGENFGLDLGFQNTPGHLESSDATSIRNGDYAWKTMSVELLGRGSSASAWRYRLGFQSHLLPFLIRNSSTGVIEVQSHFLTLASVGFDRSFAVSDKLRIEWQMRYQIPVLTGAVNGTRVQISPKMDFDGSIGGVIPLGERSRLGLYWYGQWQQYGFDYASTPAISGEQMLFYSNIEARYGLEF